jgi:hypothetical protein
MSVQELIEILQRCDPNEEVRLFHPYLDCESVPVKVFMAGPQNNIPTITEK